MFSELEIKFLDIDLEQLRRKLRGIGAQLVYEERLMKRKLFDYPDGRLDKENIWLRLRDEGDKIALTLKKYEGDTLYGMKEISVEISNFEKTASFLKAMGLLEKSYQETKRESWEYKRVQIEIDTWPWIPTFVEFEGENEEELREVVKILDFNWDRGLFGAVPGVYIKYYDIDPDQISNTKKILFSPIPEWLKEKIKI